MSWRRGQRPGRLLMGLLVLSVVLMAAAQVNALMVPSVNAFAVASSLPLHHGASAATDEYDHAESPCKGHGPSHGVGCCLSSGCPLLVVALPTAARIPTPAIPTMGTNPRLVATQRDGVGRTPDPPPPRTIG
jgi:hypothetical protein